MGAATFLITQPITLNTHYIGLTSVKIRNSSFQGTVISHLDIFVANSTRYFPRPTNNLPTLSSCFYISMFMAPEQLTLASFEQFLKKHEKIYVNINYSTCEYCESSVTDAIMRDFLGCLGADKKCFDG